MSDFWSDPSSISTLYVLARTQTFEKGDANLRVLTKGVRILKKFWFEAKIRGVNSVSGEKLHDFEIICPARGCVRTPAPLNLPPPLTYAPRPHPRNPIPVYGPDVCEQRVAYVISTIISWRCSIIIVFILNQQCVKKKSADRLANNVNCSLRSVCPKLRIIQFNALVAEQKYEPPHDKTSKVAVRPARLRSAWESAQSDQSLRCAVSW